MAPIAWALVAILAVVSPQTYGQDSDENDLLANVTAPLSDSLESSDEFDYFYKEQVNLNQLVDFAVAQAIQTIKDSHQETLPVPDINERFKIGKGPFKIKGHFEANSGTFRDLTTVHRSSDVVLSNDGLMYYAACGFGLREAKVHFDHYKLKAGVHVSGHISVEVDGIALEAKVGVNYNQRPCVSALQHVKVTHFGHPKIKISGLGPLNHLVSKLMSWVANHWRGKISHKIEDKLREVAAQQLAKLQCEKYRPN